MNTRKILTTAVAFGLMGLAQTAVAADAQSGRSVFVLEPCQPVAQPAIWMPLSDKIDNSPHSDIKTYEIELTPPADPDFHDQMGGLPTEISEDTFHAATGKMYIVEHPDMRTDITFTFDHLIPLGVYSLWDVIEPDFANFADRPLADSVTWGDDVREDGLFGGIEGMGIHVLRADQCGRAQITVNMSDHRPAEQFLLDYHANDYGKGGVKGQDVFPGALWGVFPEFDAE